jgi:UDP-GlcNAc:undecaprenyl-phosphate GlcNAc-1-phosphate transferase
MDPYLLLVYTASAFAVAFLFFPVLIKLLSAWKVFDAPGKHKIHVHYVPAMGGICILLGAGFSLLIGLPFSIWLSYKFLLVSMALMFVIGLRDDILTLTPGEKLMGQLLPIIILVVFGDTLLSSFYGTVLESVYFPLPVAWLVTVFVVVTLTNAYNLIDGIDGLAGTVAVLTLSSFGIWFYLIGDANMALMALSFVGATLAFLFFNWQPSRIFMGDTGALVVGLLLSFLAVRFINLNFGLPDSNQWKFQSSVGTAICVMIIPVLDTLRVVTIRLSRLQSPFKADHSHLHHYLLGFGYGHAGSVCILAGLNLVFIALAVILRSQGDAVILPIILVAGVVISMAVGIARKKHDSHAGKSSIATK